MYFSLDQSCITLTILSFKSLRTLSDALPANTLSISARSTGITSFPNAENSAAFAPLTVTLSVLLDSLRPIPAFKYSGDAAPPYKNPDDSPQKFALKSSKTRSDESISTLESAEILLYGRAGLNVIPPDFNIETGTVTITLVASIENGSTPPPGKLVFPLMITLEPL